MNDDGITPRETFRDEIVIIENEEKEPITNFISEER